MARRAGRRWLTAVTLAALTMTGAGWAGASAAAVPPPVGVPPDGIGGQAVSWGQGASSALTVPEPLGGETVTAVSGGAEHALALTSAGKVVGWGFDSTAATPPASLAGRTVTAIAAGDGFSLALTADGKVTAWGRDYYGVTDVPSTLAGRTVIAIAAGDSFHALALTSGGQVVAWGQDLGGDTDVPAVLAHETVTAIAVGYAFSVALTSEGTVVSWGADEDGETDVPASLAGVNVTAIAAGTAHTLAITSDGAVTTWGADYYGALDVPGSLSSRTVVAVAGGYGFSLALTSDGDVVGWGYDWDGESDPPGALAGNVHAIAAGEFFGLAIATPGPDYVQPVLTPRFPHRDQGSYHAKATAPGGAVVNYLLPTAYDAVDGSLPVTCTPAPGSVFPVGRTRVVCTATDSAGNTGMVNVFVFVRLTPTRIEVTALTPARGSVAGGAVVTLTGHGFTGALAVDFGGHRTTDFTVESDSRMTVVAPPSDRAGVVHVTVHGRGTSVGTTTSHFHYLPDVVAVAPAGGPVTGGTVVTITGHGFGGARAVLFATTPATSFTVVSDTEVTAVAPALPAGPVDVRVQAPGGTTPVGDADRYTAG